MANRDALRLLMVNSVKTDYNGQTLFIMKYLRALDRRDIVVGYASNGPLPEDFERELAGLGVRVYALPERLKKPLSSTLRLARLIRRERYNVVHVNGNSATISFELFAAWLGGARVRIAHSHNTQCTYRLLHRLLWPGMMLLANARFACGREAGEWLFHRHSFEIIPNASDAALFGFDAAARAGARERLGIGADCALVGVVAGFTGIKNHAFLLEAFARALEQRGDLRLALVGDGPLRPQIEADIDRLGLRERVVMTGFIPGAAACMQAFDALALPSLAEGFPNVLVEAQLSGLPALVSDVVTRDCDMTGLLRFIPLEVDRWRDALVALAPVDREQASAAGCRRAEERGYEIRGAAQRLRALYDAMLERK